MITRFLASGANLLLAGEWRVLVISERRQLLLQMG